MTVAEFDKMHSMHFEVILTQRKEAEEDQLSSVFHPVTSPYHHFHLDLQLGRANEQSPVRVGKPTITIDKFDQT